jgi:3-methyl-2-oxobutanoate hydroxymethyltransferase
MSEKKKMTALDFVRYKPEGRKFSFVTAYDYTMASIADESQVEIILVGDSMGMVMMGYGKTEPVTMEDIIFAARSVVRGAPHAWIIGDMPFGSYQISNKQAVKNAVRIIKETGCDSVKLEGGVEMAPRVKAIVSAGVNVIGHIGLTPQTASSLGGFKVQGGTPEGAAQLIKDAKALEKAGCIGIVVECVPSVVARAMTESVNVPVMGIGAGPYVDCQIQVTHDMMGMYGDFKPRFAKQYAQVRKTMVDAFNTFHYETLEGTFPTEEYSFNQQVEIPGKKNTDAPEKTIKERRNNGQSKNG